MPSPSRQAVRTPAREQADRERERARLKRPERDAHMGSARGHSPAKSGVERAREQVDREKEKARLKKLERERLQQERNSVRKSRRVQLREELEGDIAKQIGHSTGAPAASASRHASETRVALAAPVTREQAAADAAAAEAAAAATAKRAPPKAHAAVRAAGSKGAAAAPDNLQASVRQLFSLMDRNDTGRISRRDVLLAMRRQPAVRRLFGLPDSVGVAGGGAALQARLLAIQDSFEAGSGLGEIEPVFEELHGGGTHAFTCEAFVAACRSEPAKSRAVAAAAILPREHSTCRVFEATRSWAVVPEGAACPPGLEFKMDMESGRTLARLPL